MHEPGLFRLPRRALSLYQPWAWLVVHGKKPIENRPPGFSHRSFRGEFWVHAGLHDSENEWHFANQTAKEHQVFDLPAYGDAEALPLGAIVGLSKITGIVPPRGGRLFEGEPIPWHFPDQYGFLLQGSRALAGSVPCRGYQGFWTVPDEVMLELERYCYFCGEKDATGGICLSCLVERSPPGNAVVRR